MFALRCSLVFVPTLLTAVGCGHGPARPPRSEEEHLPRLEVVLPVHTDLLRRVELAATVEPLKAVELCARVPGVVEHLPDEVDIGRRVKAGEELIRLTVPELLADRRTKEAALEQARKQKIQAEEALRVAESEGDETQKLEQRWAADYTFQKSQHERIRGLVRDGAVDRQRAEEAQKQMEASQAAWEAAKAQIATRLAKVRSAHADLEVAGKRIAVAEAEVERVKEQIAFASIKAPFDGVLTKRWVHPGATIRDPGTVLLTVMQTDRVRVLIDVPQKDVPLVNAREQNPNADGQGDQVLVRIPALSEVVPGGEFKGTVTRMARALDPVTRTMRAEVELPNPQGHLKPNMFGTALVLLEERYDVLTIPATALVRRGDKVEVFVVAEAQGEPLRGVLQRREIELGLDDGKQVEVRRGLKGTEYVVLRGNGVMRSEDKVIAVPERPAAP
jgi:RND family efflux transporter MFP subunit